MILRRNFLSLVLLAPLAKLLAPFRSEPTYRRVGTYKRYMGTMRITREAMEAIGEPRRGAFEATVERRMSGITARAEAEFIFPYPRKITTSGR
jgi:hypothetical protein